LTRKNVDRGFITADDFKRYVNPTDDQRPFTALRTGRKHSDFTRAYVSRRHCKTDPQRLAGAAEVALRR